MDEKLAFMGPRSSALESGAGPVARECGVITPETLSMVSLNQQQIDAIVQTVPGGVANIEDIYSLSPLQEGILFHHLLNEVGDTYLISTLLQASSRAQIDLLIDALGKVIYRHQALRTAVIWDESPQPVQVVYRSATLQVQGLALDANRDPVDQLNDWMRPERQGLNLRRAPLMRLQVAEDPQAGCWYAVLQIHHIVCDHQSLNAVVAEAMECVRGRANELRTPALYRDYVAWALSRADTQNAEAFFRRKLGDVSEPTLPFGLSDVHGDGSQVEEASLILDYDITQRIRHQSRHLGVSPARIFHAAWALVVASTSGRDDVVYGTVLLATQRRSVDAPPMLGLFVNTLPLRLQLQGLTATGLVERTALELKELLNYEQSSLALVQRCSGGDGAWPLFTAVLNFRRSVGHSVIDPKTEWVNGTGLRALKLQYRTNYPIELSVDDLGEGFSLMVHVERSVDPSRILGYMKNATHSLVDALEHAPQKAALSLPILHESEYRQVTELFNATSVHCPNDTLVHELFEQQVVRTPDAIAVLHEGESLTYAELNKKANRVARHLLREGCGPGRLIAICMERSVKMVVGVLAILKAGAAYVPLDPSHPPERLQYMLDDAAPSVVLTQRQLKTALPVTHALVMVLESELLESIELGASNIAARNLGLAASNLVYVIYTSGSTGRPKGVEMPHSAMVNLIEWHSSLFPNGEGIRVLQFAALSFDVAFQEIFSTLCTGGSLVLLDEWTRRDPHKLLEFLRDTSIQRLFIPPLMLQSIAEAVHTTPQLAPNKVRDVITAGEQLRVSPEIIELFEHLGQSRLHNHYGPTETHVVTALTLSGSPTNWPALPSIGKPIANTQIYVLNGQRRPTPVGVMGEIYIGGANVATGYRGRAELTAERFVGDPFGKVPLARLYKTGDVGRWGADGAIEYIGRNDDQMKIRGFRIEPGEIEAQLYKHEMVREAVVIVREDAPAERRLVAYVTTARDRDRIAAGEVRDHLKTLLPEYMIPSSIVILDRLPLTPNGKLNRRALPMPSLDSYMNEHYEVPEGDAEQVIAEIWQSLLGIDRVGRNDNFFALGGNSLTAMRLIVNIADKLGVRIGVDVILRHPALRTLAQYAMDSKSVTRRSLESGRAQLDEFIV